MHLDAWRNAGAEQVTAQQAVSALLDDGTWRLSARLGAETLCDEGRCARYSLQLLGEGVPVSPEFPHWVLVTIPPALRRMHTYPRVMQGTKNLMVAQDRPGTFGSAYRSHPRHRMRI